MLITFVKQIHSKVGAARTLKSSKTESDARRIMPRRMKGERKRERRGRKGEEGEEEGDRGERERNRRERKRKKESGCEAKRGRGSGGERVGGGEI